MANAVYGKAREKFLNGDIDWANDDIKAVLVDTAAYAVSIDSDEYLSSIPAGDRIATSGNLASKTSTLGVADAADITFSTVTTNKRTRPVYEGSSFKRTYTFYDETGTIIDAADITSLNWLVEVTDSQEIASGTVDPPTNPYTLNVTPTINTLTGSREEKRKIVLEWTFNNGDGGDVDVYYYTLKPV